MAKSDKSIKHRARQLYFVLRYTYRVPEEILDKIDFLAYADPKLTFAENLQLLVRFYPALRQYVEPGTEYEAERYAEEWVNFLKDTLERALAGDPQAIETMQLIGFDNVEDFARTLIDEGVISEEEYKELIEEVEPKLPEEKQRKTAFNLGVVSLDNLARHFKRLSKYIQSGWNPYDVDVIKGIVLLDKTFVTPRHPKGVRKTISVRLTKREKEFLEDLADTYERVVNKIWPEDELIILLYEYKDIFDDEFASQIDEWYSQIEGKGGVTEESTKPSVDELVEKVKKRIMETLREYYPDKVPFMSIAAIENVIRGAGEYPSTDLVEEIVRQLEREGLAVREGYNLFLLRFEEDDRISGWDSREWLRLLAMLAHLITKNAQAGYTERNLDTYLAALKKAYNALVEEGRRVWTMYEPLDRAILRLVQGIDAHWDELLGKRSVKELIEEAERAVRRAEEVKRVEEEKPPAPPKPPEKPKPIPEEEVIEIAGYKVPKFPRELAERGWSNLSHFPEKQAEHDEEDYKRTVMNVIQKVEATPELTDEERQRIVWNFAKRWLDKYKELAHVRATAASAHVVGPAKFPAERMQKKFERINKLEQELYGMYDEWLKWFKKYLERKKVREVGRAGIIREEIERLKEELEKRKRWQEIMKEANKIIRSKLSQEEKLRRLKEIGAFDIPEYKLYFPEPDYMGRLGFPSYALDNNRQHIKRLEQRIKELEEKAKEAEEAREVGNIVVVEEHPEWKVIKNFEDDRVWIIFPKVPPAEVRNALKSYGFHWSPRRQAWVRKLTPRAVDDALYILYRYMPPEDIEKFKPLVIEVIRELGLSEVKLPAYNIRDKLKEKGYDVTVFLVDSVIEALAKEFGWEKVGAYPTRYRVKLPKVEEKPPVKEKPKVEEKPGLAKVIFTVDLPEGLMQPEPYPPLGPIKKGDIISTDKIHPDVLRILKEHGWVILAGEKPPAPPKPPEKKPPERPFSELAKKLAIEKLTFFTKAKALELGFSVKEANDIVNAMRGDIQLMASEIVEGDLEQEDAEREIEEALKDLLRAKEEERRRKEEEEKRRKEEEKRRVRMSKREALTRIRRDVEIVLRDKGYGGISKALSYIRPELESLAEDVAEGRMSVEEAVKKAIYLAIQYATPPKLKPEARAPPKPGKKFEYRGAVIYLDDLMKVWPDVLEKGLQPAISKITYGYLPKRTVAEFVRWWLSQVRTREPKTFRDWLFRSPPWDRVLWEALFTYGAGGYFWALIEDIYNKYKGQLLRLDTTMTFDKFKRLVMEYLMNFKP